MSLNCQKLIIQKFYAMKNILKVNLLILISLISFSCSNDESTVKIDNEKLLFENEIYSVEKVDSDSNEIINIKKYLSLVENKNKQKSIIDIEKLKSQTFKINAFQGDINLFLWEIAEELDKSNKIKGFEEKSYLLIGKNLINSNFNFSIYSVKTKGKIVIEEVKDLFSGSIYSYNLTGINDSEYFMVAEYMQDKRTICFTSFNACFYNLENSIAENPADSALCDFFPCSAINYGVCAIASGSGYIQGNSNYIGNSNCDAIYDSSGNDLAE
jgi:hypothetical protein